MELVFYKYHGTGNDFILIDNRNEIFIPERSLVEILCNRHLGIGADGLILLGLSGNDLWMRYFNSDGNESTMCGNGGRCFASFANFLGISGSRMEFRTPDGYHSAMVQSIGPITDLVRISMKDVTDIAMVEGMFRVDTGSPHVVQWVGLDEAVDVVEQGRRIRNYPAWSAQGVNVNFAVCQDNLILNRTYERGVENETLSCGTGAVAVALAACEAGKISPGRVIVRTRGGELVVHFKKHGTGYTDIYLEGPTQRVFKGFIDLSQFLSHTV